MSDGALPSFESTQPAEAPQAGALPSFEATQPGGLPSFEQTTPTDTSEYGTPGQQLLTGIEGAAQGVAGPVATAAELGLHKLGVPGLASEDILARKEENPWVHGLSEAGGFGAGMFLGTGEAQLATKAGELAVGAAKLGEASSIVGKLAAGATKLGTEMAVISAGDQASELMLDPDKSVGSAVTNIGLSTLMGVASGGVLKGTGMLAKAGLEKAGFNGSALKEFTDRLVYRNSVFDPNELVQKEFSDAMASYHQMGSEVSGVEGLKAMALDKVMPKEITPHLAAQAEKMYAKGDAALEQMAKERVPERLMSKFEGQFRDLQDVIAKPDVSPGEMFDAMNDFKQEMQKYSKGNYGPFAIPAHHEAYDFINITKSLGHDVRVALEDNKAWGDVAHIQKDLNKAWTTAIPAIKDAEKKFMSKVGDELVLDPAKFQTYMNQNGKTTATNIRQQMMGKFVDAVEKFHDATNSIYDKAGLVSPHQPMGMGALKDSLNKPSVWARAADAWYDKQLAKSGGIAAGATAGATIGHLTGIPGADLALGYLGKALGEHLLPPLIQPLIDKPINMLAYGQATDLVKNAMAGQKLLEKSAKSIFIPGAVILPQHLAPTEKQLEQLDEQVKRNGQDPSKVISTSKNLDHYVPEHSNAITRKAASATTYLNSIRPTTSKQNPLDSDTPISPMQKAAYTRALTVAQQPLVVLEHIKDGTLQKQDIATLHAIHPEVYTQLQQQLLQEVAERVQKGENVPYHTRQALSLFTGSTLDSTFTPSSIIAAQPKPKPMPQQQGAASKSMNSLGKSNKTYRTPSQTSEQDRANRD